MRRGDLFTPLADERFDVIVANPPYVPEDAGRDGSGPHPDRRFAGGLNAEVVRRWKEPFGPELRRREEWLRARGLVEDAER